MLIKVALAFKLFWLEVKHQIELHPDPHKTGETKLEPVPLIKWDER